MVFLNLDGDDGGSARHGFVLLCVLLQLPAIYLPFLIAFLPRADQKGSGWVFEHAPGVTIGLVRDATWRALVSHVLLPVHLAALVLMLVLRDDRVDAAAAAVFAAALAVLAARSMVGSLHAVPFTDDREEEGGLELGGLMGFALVLGGLGAVFGGLLPTLGRWPVAVATLALSLLSLRVRPAPADPPNIGAEAAGEPTEVQSSEADRSDGPPPVPTSIDRELRAVLVLYAALSIVPGLFGAMFAG
jgi:hypothetical protein